MNIDEEPGLQMQGVGLIVCERPTMSLTDTGTGMTKGCYMGHTKQDWWDYQGFTGIQRQLLKL